MERIKNKVDNMTILDDVNYPQDVKKLKLMQLYELADEIRTFLIDNVSKTGGHLASNLGIVELTIALHRVFNTPQDKIVWDVGHQSYVHKMLTGRKDKFETLRKFGGISGFPKPNESIYDAFATGHSSTSISSALGIAKARDILNQKYDVVAVIGDGALTGGMALEAMNDAGISNTNIIIILNDNEMSISPNVGSMSSYLSRLRTDPKYINLRDDMENLIKKIPSFGNSLFKSAEKMKESIKYLFVQGMLFEELGFTYLGPIDGHSIEKMLDVLQRARKIKGPVLIHVITKKGKGYSFAERNPEKFHGIGPFEKFTGKKNGKSNVTYSNAFGEEMIEEARKNNKIVAITAAMPDGTGLKEFAREFPNRFFDVGIAEQHAATFAAGLAANGLKPVFAVYSTFLQRAYDQVIHDVCMQNLPVIFAIDRAGIVGEDGETHQGVFDMSYLSSIPGMTILTPKDIKEFRMMIRWCFSFDSPVAIRYPRGGDYNIEFTDYNNIEYGKWEYVKKGKDIAILATGKMVQHAYIAAEKLKDSGIEVTLVNCRFIKPLDTEMIKNIYSNHRVVFTIEDNYASGGFGSAVIKYVVMENINKQTVVMGYPDEFITHGDCSTLYNKYGLDEQGIYEGILKYV